MVRPRALAILQGQALTQAFVLLDEVYAPIALSAPEVAFSAVVDVCAAWLAAASFSLPSVRTFCV
jgi:hypothetical protein